MIPKIQGNKLKNSYSWLFQPYNFLDQALDKHGLTFLLDLPTMGESLVTGDPEYISELVKNKHLVGGRGTQALRPLFGNDSLIIIEGEKHHCRRQILLPFFKNTYIRKFDNLTINASYNEIDKLPNNSSFSIFSTVRRISLKVIIQLVFGNMSAEKEETIIQLVNAYTFSFRNPLFLFIKALHINLGRYSPWGRLSKNRALLYTFVMNEINQRLANQGNPSTCLLDELILNSRATPSALSHESIFNEVLSLLLFGHDTSAVTMAWAFSHIYQNPDVLRKLQEESTDINYIFQEPGNKTDNQTDNDPENDTGSSKTSYLKASILESMRLSPVVVHLTRVAEQETRLKDHALKQDSKVLPCTYLAHHNPAVYDNPCSYNPDRFVSKSDYHYAFFPFGFGARKCIGEQLALRQMQLILAAFIKESNMALDPRFPVAPERQMLLIGPAHGTMMHLA